MEKNGREGAGRGGAGRGVVGRRGAAGGRAAGGCAPGGGAGRLGFDSGCGSDAPRGAATSLPGTAVAAVAGTAAVAVAARWLWCVRPHLVRTMSGPALVHTTRDDSGRRVRVLRTGGVYQSATYLDDEHRMEPVFEYYRALARLFELRPVARRVLAIGGGGFAFPKLVAAEHPGVRTDVVEIDPAVIRVARRWFFLDEAEALARAGGGELVVTCDDGRAFLERCGGSGAAGPGTAVSGDGSCTASSGNHGEDERRYDAVVLDAFVGAEPVRALATMQALRAARRALAPGGVLVANVVSREGGADVSFLRSFVATALTVFDFVEVAPATDDEHAEEDNYLVAASDGPLGLPDAIAYDAEFLGDVLMD